MSSTDRAPSKPEQGHRREGFTAVELIVSMLLASLLMVALMGIVRGLDVKTKALVGKDVEPPYHRVLDNVLRHDFENATEIEQKGYSFILRGYGGRNAGTGVANWKEAEITYELVPAKDSYWLVRKERAMAGPVDSRTQMDFVLEGATGFELQVGGEVANVRAGQAIDSTMEGSVPIEASVRLSIFADLNPEPLYEYEYHVW